MRFIPGPTRSGRIAAWRRRRRRRCLQTWASLILPNWQIRSQIFRRLCRWPWFRRFMSSKLGMVFFDRIVVPRFSKSDHELRSMGTDLRQILSDNAIIDGYYNPASMQAAIDSGAVVN